MKVTRRIKLALLLLLIITSFTTIAYAVNQCIGTNPANCTFSDAFNTTESAILVSANSLLHDIFHLADTAKVIINNVKFSDSFKIATTLKTTCKCNAISPVVTQTITQIPTTANPFVANDTPLDTTITTAVVPFLMFIIVVLGGYAVGLTKASTILGLIFLILFVFAKIGVIPSYFTLIGIIIVAGILTLVVTRFFRGNEAGQ